MSRLQVGGLALIIGYDKNDQNLGKTVTLKNYHGSQRVSDGKTYHDLWIVCGDDLVWPDGSPLDYCYAASRNLMPLGDKQTQDELMKELEEV